MLCLLWDIEEEKLPSIDFLEHSHLLEFRNGRVENIPEPWEDDIYLNFPAEQGWMLNLQNLQNEVKLSVFRPAGYSLHKFIWEEAKSRLNLSNQSIEYLLLSLKDQVDGLLNSSEISQNF
ncbi:hypothetical protein FM036_31505 [Nostoc sp. HG1]|nr:hypothetical protein [Nostoc sp. HG1]